MRARLDSAPAWLVALLVVVAMGCDADLEAACVAGSCAPYEPVIPPPIETECFEGCDTMSVSGHTGEYPCAVDAVIENCRRCHVPNTMSGAPFSLDTYADSQELYFDTAIWARMRAMVALDLMPQAPPLLDEAQKKTLLDDWACLCAPPRAADEICD